MRKMKKVMAAMLAATMVMSTGMTVFANTYSDNNGKTEITNPDENGNYTSVFSLDLTKKYILENSEMTSPAEQFEFVLEANDITMSELTQYTEDLMPKFKYITKTIVNGTETETSTVSDIETIDGKLTTKGFIQYQQGDASSEGDENSMLILLPTYERVGIYSYKIKESAKNSAGVTYSSREMILKVTVAMVDSKVQVTSLKYTDAQNNAKYEAFENKYSAGSLTISKDVTGTLGDRTKKFLIDITFNAPSGKIVNAPIYLTAKNSELENEDADFGYGSDSLQITSDEWENNSVTKTIELADSEQITFTNIPYGVTYTVEERDYTGDAGGYDKEQYTLNNSVLKEGEGDNIVYASKVDNEELDSASETVLITNNKSGDIDTGITLDNMPYILILAVVAIGAVGFVSKKRSSEL